jgi:hypothetical protein
MTAEELFTICETGTAEQIESVINLPGCKDPEAVLLIARNPQATTGQIGFCLQNVQNQATCVAISNHPQAAHYASMAVNKYYGFVQI